MSIVWAGRSAPLAPSYTEFFPPFYLPMNGVNIFVHLYIYIYIYIYICMYIVGISCWLII